MSYPNYRYTAALPASHIRLMRLLPGSSSKLECALEITPIDRCTSYEAISYVWGDPDTSETLEIKDSEQTIFQLSITPNLATALRQVRYANDVRILWVDRVCIDQKNVQERNEQVMIMGQIYRQAKRVLVSLGPDYGISEDAIYYMEQLALAGQSRDELKRGSPGPKAWVRADGQFQNFFGHVDGHSVDLCETFGIPSLESNAFSALKALFQHSWFRRAWTWQESFLAQEKVFHWGAGRWSEALMHETSRVLHKLRTISGNNAYRFSELILAAPMLASQKILRQGQPGTGSDLITLLSIRRGTGCKYPSDLVYSLLGAATRCPPIQVNYNFPFERVFTNVARDLIKEHSDLSILGLLDGPRDHSTLPSWVPDWRVKRADTSMSSLNDFTQARYNTTGTLKPVFRLLNHRILAVQGVQVDTIQSIRDAKVSEDNFIEKLYERESIYKPTNESTEIALWRTRCRDCNIFEPREPMQRWNSTAWLRFKKISDGVHDMPDGRRRYVEMLTAITEANIDKVLFKSELGFIGFACSMARAGDVLALLLGAQYPMLLRPTDQGYLVVGESYVHGLMDGQGINQAEQVLAGGTGGDHMLRKFPEDFDCSCIPMTFRLM